MSTTKEIKTLLEEVRLRLDEESRPKVEPILRGILDASKPRTITEVQYRGDPKDQAQIEELRATIASKDDLIRTLQGKLVSLHSLIKQRRTGMIQNFFLAETIKQTPNAAFDAQQAGLVVLNLSSYPARVVMPGLIVLRRDDAASDLPISVRFDLMDDRGKPVDEAVFTRTTATFPAGQRFCSILSQIAFVAPKPGDYRFDVTMENAPEESVFHYSFHLGKCATP